MDEVGLDLEVHASRESKQSDFLRLASTAASVSFKTPLTEQQLLHALLTGKVPANRRPHLRTLPSDLLLALPLRLRSRLAARYQLAAGYAGE